MHDPLFFLNENNYGTYNRILARKIGLIGAVLLSELIQKRHYHSERNELIYHEKHGQGWFYHTIEALEDRLGLTAEQQETAIKLLKRLDFIEVVVFGLPAKRHFRIHEEKILDLFSNKDSSFRGSRKLDSVVPGNYVPSFPETAHIIEEPKGRTKKEDIPLTADACELASFFLEEIRKIKTDFKHPNLKSWSKIFHSMLETQKREYSAIKKVITWSLKDPFWHKVILSAKTVNDKFDQLEIGMRAVPSKSKENFRDRVLGVVTSGERYGNYEIDISQDSVAFIALVGQMQPKVIKFSEGGFVEQFNNEMRKIGLNKKI